MFKISFKLFATIILLSVSLVFGGMDEPTNWNGTTPESGDYKIEVAPDRGNATYRLAVSVE